MIGKTYLDALAREGVGEQVVGPAIQLCHGNDVVAHLGKCLDRIGDGSHSRSHCQTADAAFHRGKPLLQHVIGRVHDARVDIARHLEIEQVCTMLGVVERVGGGLVDRNSHGLGSRIGRVTGVYC